MNAELLLLRFVFSAAPASRLRRRGHDMRDSRIVHFFIQCGKVFLRNLLDLCRSIAHQRDQLRQLFFLLAAGRSRKFVQVSEQRLYLVRQWIGFPFERRPCIPQSLTLPDKLFRDGVHFLLEFNGRFHDIVGDLRRIGFVRVLLPLFSCGFQCGLDAFDGSAVFVRGFSHRVELVERLTPCRTIRGSSSTVTFCVASLSPALILMVYSPGSTSGPRGPNPNPAAAASNCCCVASAGEVERKSQFVRLTPASPGPSNSRSTFPSLSSTLILTLPSFFSAASAFVLSSSVSFLSLSSFSFSFFGA